MTDAEKEKESESHKKVDMESFIKQYGAIKGKSVYYKTMKRRAMGKGKKSIKKKWMKLLLKHWLEGQLL